MTDKLDLSALLGVLRHRGTTMMPVLGTVKAVQAVPISLEERSTLIAALNRIPELEQSAKVLRDEWQASTLTYAKNAEYWRKRAERAETEVARAALAPAREASGLEAHPSLERELLRLRESTRLAELKSAQESHDAEMLQQAGGYWRDRAEKAETAREGLRSDVARLLALAPAIDPDNALESGQVIAFRYHGGPVESRPWSVPEHYPAIAAAIRQVVPAAPPSLKETAKSIVDNYGEAIRKIDEPAVDTCKCGHSGGEHYITYGSGPCSKCDCTEFHARTEEGEHG